MGWGGKENKIGLGITEKKSRKRGYIGVICIDMKDE